MSALRTISLRLRGTSVEVLEQMGEETDGVIESTSKLQEKIKALSGVDILSASGGYRNPYEILKDIAEVYDEMESMDQAALIELISGKNRANTLAAILTNFEDLENAYQDALGAEGSAMRENEAYLDSIQGRIDLFTNALQTMWMNFLNADAVKWFVDLGTTLVKVTDEVGILNIAIAGVATYFTAIKKHNPVTMFKDLVATMQNYNQIIKQVQSISSIIGPTKVMSFDQFNAGPVHAYAAAVSNLTAKQQAATLAASGLNSEQIASVLATNGLSSANIKLAMSEAGVAQAKTQTAAATGLQIAAAMKQQGVALSQKATNFLLAHSTEEVTKKMLAKAVVAGQITHQEAVLIMKSMGVVAANTAQAFSWKALGTAISAAFKSNPIGMLISIASAVTAIVIPALDALIDSTEEVKQKAEDALTEYSNSQSELKKTKSTMDALSDDYAKLASGVDEFGNNISLSTSQYERYNEIVNQIADMFPQMVKGYTAEGNAIIKNKGNVEALTAAYESLQSVASNTLLASADDIMQNYKNTFENKWYEDGPSTDSNKIKASRELSKMLNNQDTYKFGAYFNNSKNDGIITTMVNLLEDAGIEEKSFFESSEDYVKRALTEFPGIVQSIINTWESTANAAVSNVKPLISAYLDTSVGYAGLNDQQKQVIDSMVASLDEEFFNAFDGDASKLYTALESMIQNLKTSGLDDEYNLMLNVKTSFNNDELTVKEYQDEISEFQTKLDKLVADGLLSEIDAKYIKLSLGIDDEGISKELDPMVAYAQKIIDAESKDKVLTLTYSDLQIINSDDFEVPEGTLLSWAELKQKIAEIRATMPTDINTVQTYTALSEKASSYNDILTQTNEITADNMEVTQEYKDSLSDLGFTTEELSECFDENNDLVVKNAEKLRKLVAEKKKAAAADVKLAKSQSRLEYYDLVKQLSDTLDGTKQLDDATRASINSTLEQLNVVEQAIYKYQLLEDSLLGTTNAFEEFAKAQEVDALNTYGDSYVEMVQTMYDGLYKTGEVGTEAFWAAVEHLVPADAYQHLTEDADRMKAIYEYFNKKIAPTLTLEDDAFSMDYDSIENFVEQAIKLGVFNKDGKTGKFNLVEGMNLEKAAELMDMTTAQAYAFFAELDKYNLSGNEHSFLLQLDDSTEGQIMKATTELEDLNKQKLALLEDGGYEKHGEELAAINAKIKTQTDELDKLGQQAAKTWQEYSRIDSTISALNKVSDKTTKLSEQEAIELGVKWKEGMTVEDAIKQLEEQRAVLEEPTVLTAQLAQEHIKSELADLEKELGKDRFITIKAKLEQDENGQWKITENSGLSEADLKYAQQIANLLNADKDLTTFLQTGLTKSETYLSSIDGTLKSILTRLGGEPAGNEGGAANNSGTEVYGPPAEDPFGGLKSLLDKYGLNPSGGEPEVYGPPAGNDNYVVGGENVTVSTETVDLEQSGDKGTKGSSEQNQGYIGINNPDMVPYERWKRGEILLPWEENILPKPSVDEDAILESLGLDKHESNDLVVIDPTVSPGPAYVPPETMSGGNMEAEQVTIETPNVSGGGGAVGGLFASEKPVIEAEHGLPNFVDPSTWGEPKEATIDVDLKVEEGLDQIAQQIQEEYEQANVDLLNRPKVDWTDMNAAGWNTPEGSYSTVDTVTFTANDFGLTDKGSQDYAINVTPILPDGTVIDGGQDGLWQYINDELNKGNQLENLDVFLGSYETIEEAENAAQRLHELQEEYYATKDGTAGAFPTIIDMSASDSIKEASPIPTEVELETEEAEAKVDDLGEKTKEAFTVDEILINEGLDKLTLDNAFDNFGGATILDTTVFTQVLQEADYTKEQIDSLISKIQEYQKVITTTSNPDPLGLNSENLSIDSLKNALDSLGIKYKDTIGRWFDGKRELEIDVPDLVTELQSRGWTDTAIQSYLSQLSTIDFGKYLVFQSEPFITSIDGLIGKLSNVPDEKQVEVEEKGAAATEQALKGVEALTGDVTKTVTTEYVTKHKTVGSTQKSSGTGIISSVVGAVKSFFAGANGTAHAQGTAHKGGSWGAPKTETALTGELGPELRVRGNRWELLGENGAEFNEVRKGDIIFNHKQTEQLLTNGYITGRGKAFAEGTIGGAAYSGLLKPLSPDKSLSNTAGTELSGAAGKLSGAAGDVSDAADEFREVFDWIEVRLEEINERLGLKGAKLENAVGSTKQNAIIDDMIELNQTLYSNLTAGANKYYAYAKILLAKVPEEYRKAAQDGSIAIEEFIGEADEKTLQAIQDYREWVQKGADATQQAEETLTEIQNLAKQAIDNISQEYENKASIPGIKIEQLEAYNALIETTHGAESAKVYEEMIKATNKQIAILQSQRHKMQQELNAQVEAGNIKKYSQAWYDAVGEIAAVDTEIINLTADTEDYQDTINELHWEHLDRLLSRFEALSNEAENLIDILGNGDLVDKDTGEWTDEGIASLGLYAQQMEIAEMQAKKYKEEIQYLNKNWKKLGYTEQEYVEKLEELKEGQYDSIKAYEDTKDAIVDLNKTRVDEIKNIIEKEIEAYEELIQKQKEALEAEKDIHDFEKTVAEQQKTVADIERKLAALEGDNSASARAQRAKLQAELAKANADLEDIYYDRSMSNKQDALDKELEAFQKEKDEEMEAWDEYLEDTEKVVADSLNTIQINTEVVYDTLQAMSQEYSLFIADALTSPWEEGSYAVQSYSEKFGLAMSATVEELKKVAEEYKATMAEMEQAGKQAANTVTQNVSGYQNATYKEPAKKEETTTPSTPVQKEETITLPTKGSKVKVKAGTTNWGAKSSNKKMASWVPGNTYTVSNTYGSGSSADILLSKKDKDGKTVYMGWINVKDLEGYAKGTTGVKNNQFALIDELGEELVIRPSKGRMTFMEKGTGVVPADLTSNLMGWGELDPSVMLERNKPEIKVSPEIHNTEFNLTMDIAEVVHIDRVDNETLPDLTKAIDKQLDKYMKNLNNQIRRYVR